MRRDGPMKFEKDFDFESANAQFNKEELEREFQSKLKLRGEVTNSGPKRGIKRNVRLSVSCFCFSPHRREGREGTQRRG